VEAHHLSELAVRLAVQPGIERVSLFQPAGRAIPQASNVL
jgi:hypothetical protein